MTGRQYNLLDIQNIIFNGIYYKLDDDIMKKIRGLEKELGVVEEPKQAQRQVIVTPDKKRVPQIIGQQPTRRNGDKKNKEIYAPGFWWSIMLIIKLIPQNIFNKVQL